MESVVLVLVEVERDVVALEESLVDEPGLGILEATDQSVLRHPLGELPLTVGERSPRSASDATMHDYSTRAPRTTLPAKTPSGSTRARMRCTRSAVARSKDRWRGSQPAANVGAVKPVSHGDTASRTAASCAGMRPSM